MRAWYRRLHPDDKFFVWLGVLVLGILIGGALAYCSFDDTTWEQTEDPSCYLQVHKYRSLFSADHVERVRYCVTP